MTTEVTRASRRVRRMGMAISLVVVLLMCAWQAGHDDEEPALPLTRATSGGVPPATRSTTAAQERRLVVALERALAKPGRTPAFSALTLTGRNAWSSAAPTPGHSLAVAPADAGASAATAAVPEFPFQWVGTLNPAVATKDAAENRPVGILAGPNATRMVKQGDVVDEDWKIASLSAEQLQVIHLPSSSRQTINKNKQ